MSTARLLLALMLVHAAAAQQGDTVRAMRFKISAGDLPSAESILESHRAEKGDDAEYLLGVAWLARGAALLGDWDRASRYAEAALRGLPNGDKVPETAYAQGTAIDVRAQVLQRTNRKAALAYLEKEIAAHAGDPVAFRSRLQRRWNLIGLAGRPAPDFSIDDQSGAEPSRLSSLKGQPVVLFFWAAWCGDCKAQAPVFKKIVEKYQPRGVRFIAPTRFYEEGSHDEERTKTQSVWQELYAGPRPVPVAFSEEAMLRYGVSATPTFTFIDRQGTVRLYSPYRMTEERLTGAIESILK